MGAAAPSEKKHAAAQPHQPLVLELAASTKAGQLSFTAFGLVCDRPGDEEIKIELMPDRLHPNAQGQRLMAHCIRDALRELDRRKAPGVTKTRL